MKYIILLVILLLCGCEDNLRDCPQGYKKKCASEGTGVAMWIITKNPGFMAMDFDCKCVKEIK